ncbi:hypothetical protein [Nostoc sp. NMS8]|uniref:hypothetical protein n=1 Tax=Nostoc sp. NMS8 TaxID=2815392 RepID=UPI0025D34455|nr:hypothetical protein [Nostoc sp. NMS8]MBN3959795.1 hypothetical protein [Nostoc sp. NMS8]
MIGQFLDEDFYNRASDRGVIHHLRYGSVYAGKCYYYNLLGSLLAPQGVYAQNTDTTSQAFMRAAPTVMTFDYFATKCKQGSG